jgi:hypothetical protein
MSGLTKDDWPQFAATRHTPRGSEFRIGTRSVYVDTPNGLINAAIARIHKIEDAYDDPEDAYETVQQKLDQLNELIRRPVEELTGEDCDWIRLQVQKRSMAKKPYNIQVILDWEDLLDFLERVAENQDIAFTDKYQYIFTCRNIKLPPKTEDEWLPDHAKETVRAFASNEFTAYTNRLRSLQDTVSRVSGTCRQKNAVYLYYLYSKDCLHSFEHITELLDTGRITACYRELRNIIEELTVALFYDKLVIEEQKIRDPYPLPTPTHNWFTSARQQQAVLGNLRDLKDCFSAFIQSLYGFTHGGHDKDEIWDLIIDNLNVSLFIAAASTDQRISEWSISDEARPELVDRATETTEHLLRNLRDIDTLSTQEETFAQELIAQLLPHGNEFWVMFPTGFFARQYVSKYFSEDLNRPYNRYSHFSHAYPDSWQIAPGSSILEYNLFYIESHTVADKMDNILTDYEALL